MSRFICVLQFFLTVCTQGTFQKFSVLQCKTCNGLCEWTLYTSVLVSCVLSGVGYAALILSHCWVYTCEDCKIVLHVFGKICNIKGKLTEVIAYKLAVILKMAHEDDHSWPFMSIVNKGQEMCSMLKIWSQMSHKLINLNHN